MVIRLWCALPVCAPWCQSLRPLPLCHGPWSFPLLALAWLLAPALCHPSCPVPVGACLLPWASPRPLAGVSSPFPCHSPALALSLFTVWWWWDGGGACGAPIAHDWGSVVLSHRRRVTGWGVGGRPWTASRKRASHAVCGMAASGAASLGLTRVRVRISSQVCTICTPARLPAPPAHFGQQQSSRKAGVDHQARWAGSCWGEGSELDVRRWRWRQLWRGLGVEDVYRRGGEQEARCCLWGGETWTWDSGGGPGGAWGSGSGGGGGWGWGMSMGGTGNGKRGAGRGGRRIWDGGGARGGALGSGSDGSRALGGRGGDSGSGSGASERLRRGGAVGSVRAGGGCAWCGVSGSAAVCGTGPRRGAG